MQQSQGARGGGGAGMEGSLRGYAAGPLREEGVSGLSGGRCASFLAFGGRNLGGCLVAGGGTPGAMVSLRSLNMTQGCSDSVPNQSRRGQRCGMRDGTSGHVSPDRALSSSSSGSTWAS